MLVNGQIASTRKAAGAFDTIGDYDLARAAASAGLVQFEGMHQLAPDNEDALFMLAKGWVGYGYAFAEDDYEAAVDAMSESLAQYHQQRAIMAYDRALFYGLELLNRHADGFDTAQRDVETLRPWLEKNFTNAEDAEILFWTGYAWLARVNIDKENVRQVSRVWIGVEMLERANALDPAYMRYGASLAIAAYHSRSGMADTAKAKAIFEDVIAKTQRKALLALVNYASRYGCLKQDRSLYEKTLQEVVNAQDPDPTNRLQNAVAKRRARRYLGKSRMSDCGFD
jgi:hypothetical protein